MFRSNGYRYVFGPESENRQDNIWSHGLITPDNGPWRTSPAELPFREWDPSIRRWRQGPQILPNFKPKHYFTRPHDGKRAGTLGRLKDAMSGEGADVFITASGDKRTLMRDRPQRWQWTGWGLTPDELMDKMEHDRDFRLQDLQLPVDTKWTGEQRNWRPLFNFKNRKFETAYKYAHRPDKFWTDAHWPEGAHHNSRSPLTYRDGVFDWWSAVPWWSGRFAGGRPRP